MAKENVPITALPKEILMAAWAIALGAIAPMLDSTMVNIAIDQLTKDFNTSLHIIQWAITGYVLALAVAVPVSGWLMNQFNGKEYSSALLPPLASSLFWSDSAGTFPASSASVCCRALAPE